MEVGAAPGGGVGEVCVCGQEGRWEVLVVGALVCGWHVAKQYGEKKGASGPGEGTVAPGGEAVGGA